MDTLICKYSVEKVHLQPGSVFGAGIAGSCGSRCPCSGAGSKPSTFGSKRKETLPTKREKYEVRTHFHRRNVLPACKMICKQENLWYLGIEFLIGVLFVLFHFQLELGLL